MNEAERRRLRAQPAVDDSDDAADAGDSEEDGEKPAKKRLRFVDVLSEVPNGDAAAAVELVLTGRGLTEVDPLEAFKGLKKLELKNNHLADASCVEMSHQLCWLGLARNRLRRLTHLQNLHALAVLDVSDNRIARLDGLEGLVGLKACIAARNRITRLDTLAAKRHPLLETLVLSHNCVKECSLSGFSQLKKLSLGHNQLHAFPSLKHLPELAELRVNGNKFSTVGACVGVLPKLSILDVGNNSIVDPKGLEPLRGLLKLKSLSVRGNAAAPDCESGPLKALLASLQSLEILNDKRRSGASRKRNRQPRDPTACGGKGNGKSKGRDAPEPPEAISNHGREFTGKRAVFSSSDEEGEAPVKTEAPPKEKAQIKAKIDRRPPSAEVYPTIPVKISSDMGSVRPKKKKRRKAEGVADDCNAVAEVTSRKLADAAGERGITKKNKKKRKPSVEAAVESSASATTRTKTKKRKVVGGKI